MMTPTTTPTTMSTVRAVELGWRDWSMNFSAWLDGSAVLRDEQPADQVEEQSAAAEDGQHDEDDPDDHRVDAQPAGEAGGDAAENAVGLAAAQGRAGGGGRRHVGRELGVLCHGSSLFRRGRLHIGEQP